MVLCYGFGQDPSADFTVSASMVCGLLAQALELKFGPEVHNLSLYANSADGACSAADLASDPSEPAKYIGAACSWASDILGALAAPAGVLASLGCTLAPAVGHSLGSLFESVHEFEVAADVVQHGKCIKYSPTHFGSPWLAVKCAPGDPGFSNLPIVAAGSSGGSTSGGGGSPSGGGSNPPGGGGPAPGGGTGNGAPGSGQWTEAVVTAGAGEYPIWMQVSCGTVTSCALNGYGGPGDEGELFAWSTSPLAGTSGWGLTQPNGAGGYTATSIECLTSGTCVASEGDNGANPGAGYQTFGASGVETGRYLTNAANELEEFTCPTTQSCLASATIAIGEVGLVASSDAFPGSGQQPAWSQLATSSVVGPHSPKCPSTTLCVVLGFNKAGTRPVIATSPSLTGPWSAAEIALSPYNQLRSLSCPNDEFCAAVAEGSVYGKEVNYVITSTNPSAAEPEWQVTELPTIEHDVTASISCPIANNCVVAYQNGVLTSTDATGGTPAWTFTKVAPYFGHGGAVSCPSVQMCVFATGTDAIWTSSDPFGG
jgi:hypothetical protein